MLIEIATLPPAIQQQILAVQKGEIVQFANNGEVLGQLSPNNINSSSINATAGLLKQYNVDGLKGDDKAFGLLKDYGVDGLEYERACREEWVREWD